MAPRGLRSISALLPLLLVCASSASNRTRANWTLEEEVDSTAAPEVEGDEGGKMEPAVHVTLSQYPFFYGEIVFHNDSHNALSHMMASGEILKEDLETNSPPPPLLHVSFSSTSSITEQLALSTAATPEHGRVPLGHLNGFGLTVPPRKPWLPPIHHDSHHLRGTSRFGPYFEEGADGSNVTARLGSTVSLDCKIGMLQDKTVTWLHRKGDAIHLLTVGRQAYSSDSRFSLAYRYPNNWRLQIEFITRRDEGLYECQVATHPARVRKVFLRVTAPEIKIVDEDGHEVLERHYKAGSQVELTCIASQLEESEGEAGARGRGDNEMRATTPIAPPVPKGAATRVQWRHGESTISHNSSGKVIGVRTSEGGRKVSVTLTLKTARKADGGNYTCSVGGLPSATVSIHILNGELPAAVQYGNSTVPFAVVSVFLQLCGLALTLSTFFR